MMTRTSFINRNETKRIVHRPNKVNDWVSKWIGQIVSEWSGVDGRGNGNEKKDDDGELKMKKTPFVKETRTEPKRKDSNTYIANDLCILS